jgi:hypothetical protein
MATENQAAKEEAFWTMSGKDFNEFDKAMRTILRADPKAIRDAVDAEIRANTAARRAKGEHKRGRKKRKVSPPASHEPNDQQGT